MFLNPLALYSARKNENLRATVERVAARSIQRKKKGKNLPLLGRPLFHAMDEAGGEEKKGRSANIRRDRERRRTTMKGKESLAFAPGMIYFWITAKESRICLIAGASSVPSFCSVI